MKRDDQCQLSPCAMYLSSLTHSQMYRDGSLSSGHGFLPPKILVDEMPSSHSAWEDAARSLSGVVFSGMAQRMLRSMPVLPADESSLPDPYLKRAAVIMGLLASAYWRFGIEKLYFTRNSDIDDSLPDAILQPWMTICRRLGRKRHYQSTEDLLLNNFTFADASKVGADGSYRVEEAIIENIKNLIPAFDNEAERVFYSSIVEVHAAASPIIGEICLAQHRIKEAGPDACDDVADALVRMSECVKRSTRALMKVTAQQASKTYCDPILWSKTIAIFNVPPTSYPSGPMSGSASPFVHTMDALVGRGSFKSEYGKFSKKIHDNFIPDKLRGFLEAMHQVSLREYVSSLQGVDDARWNRVASAFNELVDAYANDDGFLGKHVAKVFHYLGIGTLVGRNQSTSGDQRYVRKHTWAHVAMQLRVAAAERLVEKTTGHGEIAAKPAEIAARDDLPSFSIVDVATHRFKHDGWIVLGNHVFDVTDYVMKHPGGAEIVCANLGRCASTDFDAIPGHGRSAVQRMLANMVVGVFKQPVEAAGQSKWYAVLDYATKVHNSLQIQFDHAVDPISKLAFCGQAYCHYLDEHLGSIAELLGTERGTKELSSRRLQVSAAFRQRVMDAIDQLTADEASSILDHLRSECLGLSDELITLCSRVIETLESGKELADWEDVVAVNGIVSALNDWVVGESYYWKAPQSTLKIVQGSAIQRELVQLVKSAG